MLIMIQEAKPFYSWVWGSGVAGMEVGIDIVLVCSCLGLGR